MDELLSFELLDAVFKGNIDEVKSILDSGLTLNEANIWGKKAMRFAIKRNQTEIMKLLFERGFYTTESGLFASIFFDDVETLKKLLNKEIGASIRDALFIAANLGKIEIVKIMLDEFKVDFYTKNKEGKTALDIAKTNEQNDVVHFLSKYEYTNNQLIRACKCLKTEQVKMFLKKGANVNFMDITGESVLEHANKAFCKDKNAVAQRKEIINLLLENGAKS